MGTPCACTYATLFFTYFKRQFLLRKYWKNILFYKQYIDDNLGVWIEDTKNPYTWEEFNI